MEKKERNKQYAKEYSKRYRAEGRHMQICLKCGISHAVYNNKRHILSKIHQQSLIDPDFVKFEGETYEQILTNKNTYKRLMLNTTQKYI